MEGIRLRCYEEHERMRSVPFGAWICMCGDEVRDDCLSCNGVLWESRNQSGENRGGGSPYRLGPTRSLMAEGDQFLEIMPKTHCVAGWGIRARG